MTEPQYIIENGAILRKIGSLKDIAKSYNQKKRKIDVFRSNNITDATFDRLKELFHCLRVKDPTFRAYKSHYDEMCRICGIPNTDSIIVSEKFIRGENNRNTVEIQYSTKTKKIIIPEGYVLHHQSPANNIKELTPTFRGKAGKGYLYSSPRIYFSLRKLPKICADVSNKTEMTLYTPDTTIQTAMIDPLLPNFGFGAVYVDTIYPIKVIKMEEYQKRNNAYSESVNEEVFESVEDFMAYYGLTYADDDLPYEESVRARIGNYLRKRSDKKFVKDRWKSEQRNITGGTKTVALNRKDSEQIKGLWEIVTKTDHFSVYKSAFQKLLSFFGIHDSSVVINKMTSDGKTEDSDLYTIQTHHGKRKIIIPNGTLLIHTSPANNIAELKPTFRSRTIGRFLYPDQRVYFSLGKPISSSKAGLEKQTTFKYTPKETVQTAYIDPAAPNFSTRAVYLTTSTSIPVISLEKKSEEINNRTHR